MFWFYPREFTDQEGYDERLYELLLRNFEAGDERIELRLKLENHQHTGAFKARGAWNQVRQLSETERAGGVVACSSGNHGKALAWAARRAGVPATIVCWLAASLTRA